MNNLDNLNLPEDSLKDEQQGNAQLATETQQQAEPELTQDAVVQINEEIIMAETEEPVIATNNSGDDYSGKIVRWRANRGKPDRPRTEYLSSAGARSTPHT